MSQLEQAIKVVNYLMSQGIDLDTAAQAAEKRYQTPRATLVTIFKDVP